MIDATKIIGSAFNYATYPGAVLRKFYTFQISNYLFSPQKKQDNNIVLTKTSFWKDYLYIKNYQWSINKLNFQIVANLILLSISSVFIIFVAKKINSDNSNFLKWITLILFWFGYSLTCHTLPTRIEYFIFKDLVSKSQSKFKIILKLEKYLIWFLVFAQYLWFDLVFSLLLWWLINTIITF